MCYQCTYFLYSAWTNDFDGGKSITRAIGRVDPRNGFAPIKIITSRAILTTETVFLNL
jgi:hypothetical protein